MDSTRLGKITRTYDLHPLRAATILERLQSNGRSSDISEDDLATDAATFITDQNHTGGLHAVVQLARLVGLQQTDLVLDIGTGLGGTPRVLADRIGCRCHGIELTPSRYRDAAELTRLVGLEHLVSLSCGDFLTASFPHPFYDVIIALDTFMHFEDLDANLRKCAALLHDDGRLAVEDGFLRRKPANGAEQVQLAAAWDHWNGCFPSMCDWQEAIGKCGFLIDRFDDRTNVALQEYNARLQRLHQMNQPPERHELAAWRLGEKLMRTGVIGTMRLICRRRRH